MKIEKVAVKEIDDSIPFLYPSRIVEIKTTKGTIRTPNRCATSYEFNRKQELPTTIPLDNRATIYSKKLTSKEIGNLLSGNEEFGILLESIEKMNRLAEYSDLHISEFQLFKSAGKGPSPIEILSTNDNLNKFMRMYLRLHEEANNDIIPIPHLDLARDQLKSTYKTAEKAIEKINRQSVYSLDLAYPYFAEALNFIINDLQSNCVNLIYRRYRNVPQSYEELRKYARKDIAFIMTDVERANFNNSDLSVMHYMPFFGNDLYAVQPPTGFPKKSKTGEKKKKVRNIGNLRLLNRKELTIKPIIENTISNQDILNELNSSEETTLKFYLDNVDKAQNDDQIYKIINSLTRIHELQGSTKEFTVLGAYVKQHSAIDYVKSKKQLYERLAVVKAR